MMATWSQSEDSSDDESENEFANMCFMAFEDQDKVILILILMMMKLVLNMMNYL